VTVTVAPAAAVNIDVTAFSERLPRPGETIHGERYTMSLGGKGANQAAAVAASAPVAVHRRTGTDASRRSRPRPPW